MKFNTNFVNPTGQVRAYLVGFFIFSSAAAIIISIALYISARQISAEMPMLEERLLSYQKREIYKSTELLPHNKLIELRAQIAGVNSLISASGQTLPQLFTRLEKLIPDGVWLESLQYRSVENEIKLAAVSFHGEHLTDFMGRLERSGYFSQVLLIRQMQHSNSAQGAIQFDIQLKGKS